MLNSRGIYVNSSLSTKQNNEIKAGHFVAQFPFKDSIEWGLNARHCLMAHNNSGYTIHHSLLLEKNV